MSCAGIEGATLWAAWPRATWTSHRACTRAGARLVVSWDSRPHKPAAILGLSRPLRQNAQDCGILTRCILRISHAPEPVRSV